MSFFVSTNGVLHPYNFHYLDGAFEKARLEKTEVHGEEKIKRVKIFPDEQKDFYAIDIMSKPVIAIKAETHLNEVRKLMKEKDIRHIAVTNKDKLVGMVSDRDLLKVDLAGTFSFMKAEDIMSTVLVVALDETPLAHIARVLMEEKISALPIVDKDHLLVGMISRTDILRAVVYNRLILK